MDESQNKKIFNKTRFKQYRQSLRNNSSEPEKRLWQVLRSNQLGVKFRRQHGICQYIVDFYCAQLKLIIEVDGDSHFSDEACNYDAARDKFLSSLGFVTVRIKNDEVMQNIEGVYEIIKKQIESRAKN